MYRLFHCVLIASVCVGCVLGMDSFSQDEPAGVPRSSTISDALTAELSGDVNRRDALLSEALRNSSGDEFVRWQAGYIRGEDGEWYTPEQVAEETDGDASRSQYYQLRRITAGSVAGEIELAKWCQDHAMDFEERFHWLNVLRVVPTHEEALRRVRKLAIRQRVLAKKLVAKQGSQRDQRKNDLDTWLPIAKKLFQRLASRDATQKALALEELRAIRDPAAIDALVQVFHVTRDRRQMRRVALKLGKSRSESHVQETAKLLVEVLGNMPEHPATLALVEQAVFSPWDNVRTAATLQLKSRPKTDFVPLLVGNLRIVETDCYDQVGYAATRSTGTRLYIETAEATQFIEYHRLYRFGAGIQYAGQLQRTQLVATTVALTRINAAMRAFESNTKQLNKRIKAVLVEACGEQFDGDPSDCWDAWREYNELSSPTEKTSYRRAYLAEITNPYGYPDSPTTISPSSRGSGRLGSGGGTSGTTGQNANAAPTLGQATNYPVECFPRGTPVWTLTGPRAIETIEPGDRVLAQNPNTGELGYKAVLQTTTREPTPTVHIRLPNGTISVTRGHRFWETGHGWRMSKFLEPGRMLHGLGGSQMIESVEPGEDEEAFNLVVADFHTYFVGKGRLLVHDNGCPRPTLALLPGWRPNRVEVISGSEPQ